jgi:hypothetical protein
MKMARKQSTPKSQNTVGSERTVPKPDPLVIESLRDTSPTNSKKLSLPEIATVVAGTQIAVSLFLYIWGYVEALHLVTALGGKVEWVAADFGLTLVSGALSFYNAFFEFFEPTFWFFLSVGASSALFMAIFLWVLSFSCPKWLERFGKRSAFTRVALVSQKIDIKGWPLVGRAFILPMLVIYALIGSALLIGLIALLGYSRGNKTVETFKREHTAMKKPGECPSSWVSVDSESPSLCAAQVYSSARGHVLWNGTKAYLLPIDSTKLSSKLNSKIP